METKDSNEIMHIEANHLLRKNARGYRISSKSNIFRIIRDLIRCNWIECKNIDGPFLFVGPSEKLITAFRAIGADYKIYTIPAI